MCSRVSVPACESRRCVRLFCTELCVLSREYVRVRRVWWVPPPPGQWDLPSEPEEGGLGAAPRFAERFTHACFRLCLGKSPSKPGKEVARAALCRLREVERLTHGHTAAVSK